MLGHNRWASKLMARERWQKEGIQLKRLNRFEGEVTSQGTFFFRACLLILGWVYSVYSILSSCVQYLWPVIIN